MASVLADTVHRGALRGVFRARSADIVPPDGSVAPDVARRAWHAATAADLADPRSYDPGSRYDWEACPVLVRPRQPTAFPAETAAPTPVARTSLRRAGDLLRARSRRRRQVPIR